MDQKIKHALETEKVIDITTTGRKTGKPRRIEIWFHHIDGKIYITGSPGRQRDWYQNMVANPQFTFHLKQSVTVDLDAISHPITDENSRRQWFTKFLEDSDRDVEAWVRESPLVEVTFTE